MSRLLALALVLALAPAVRAEGLTPAKKAEAKQHYESGTRLFDVGHYAEAATEFEAAYTIVGDPVILYNVAQSYRLGQNYERAVFFYKSYLRRMNAPPNREEVERRISEMNDVIEQQKKAREAPPVTTLKPSEPVEKPGEKPAEEKPAPPPTTAPVEQPPPPEPKPPSRALKPAGIALAVVAAGWLATGAAMSALASQASSDVQNAASSGTARFDGSLRSKESNGKLYDTVAIVGYVCAGAFAVAAGVTLYLALRKPAASRAARLDASGVHF